MISLKSITTIGFFGGAVLLAGCSGEKKETVVRDEPAPTEAVATPAATSTPVPIATPEDGNDRTRRVAEHQRRIQEIIKQKQLEAQQNAQPPGTETQYQ